MRHRALIPALLLTATLTACGSGQAAPESAAGTSSNSTEAETNTEATSTTVEQVTPTPTPTGPRMSDHGFVLGDEGKDLYFSTDTEGNIATFTVHEVARAACDNSTWKGSENGLIIRVNMTVDIGASETAKEVPWTPGNLHGWRAYSADGSRIPTAATVGAYGCMASNAAQLPSEISAGEKVTGDVFLDVATDKGSIAWIAPGTDVGLEWNYDATK